MNKDFLNIYIDIIILNILNKRDSYGYVISKNIKDKIKGNVNINGSLIYLTLKKMEMCKFISSYWTSDSNRKKYYSITEEGKKYLKDKKKEWNNNKIIMDKLLEN